MAGKGREHVVERGHARAAQGLIIIDVLVLVEKAGLRLPGLGQGLPEELNLVVGQGAAAEHQGVVRHPWRQLHELRGRGRERAVGRVPLGLAALGAERGVIDGGEGWGGGLRVGGEVREGRGGGSTEGVLQLVVVRLVPPVEIKTCIQTCTSNK